MPEPERLHVLLYTYVEGMLERRAAHREAHLAHIAAWKDEGRLLMAGGLGDPPEAGLLVFRVDGPADVERFADEDPYTVADLVVSRTVLPWAVVA